jgi:uncharacterized membrane protein
MVMKQITQKHELEAMGGFSDERLRFFILAFMSLGLIMTPFLGVLVSFIVVLIFGIFTAVKINEFQQSNPESILRHRQAMDRMYHNSVNAKYYEEMLKPYEKKVVIAKNQVKTKVIQRAKRISRSGYQNLAFSK